ncbi:unnamed protein product [Rotaria sp. Silwood1]|nr:unnamed protein product [Rotaria sp. Silwood1]
MVCDRVLYRTVVQTVFFLGIMAGGIFFGTMSDSGILRRDSLNTTCGRDDELTAQALAKKMDSVDDVKTELPPGN